MDKFFKKLLAEPKLQIAIIVAISFLVWANSLVNKLVWDDHLFLENWPDIQSTQQIGQILRGSAPPAQDKVYRPLRGIFYVVDWQIWKNNPFGYHLQALLIHLSITVLVFLITKELFMSRDSAGTPSALATRLNNAVSHNAMSVVNWMPFVVAILFGIHPIHTETIDYIAASMETWGTLFFFVAFYLYVKADDVLDEGLMWLMRVGSVVAALVAFFTYEMTLTLPILLVLFDLCFRQEYLKSAKVPRFKIYDLRFTIFSFAFFIPAALYAFIRLVVLHITTRTDYLAYSFYHTMLVMVKVFLRYILLLLVPFHQTAIHNLVGEFPASMTPYDSLEPILSQNLFDFDVLGSLVALVLLVLVGIRVYRQMPAVSFAIFWFFIALLPVSFIIPPGGAMAEKYLYIASFGFLVGLVYGGAYLYSRIEKSMRVGVVYTAVILAIFYMISTVGRNAVWRNDITLFEDVVKKAPNNLLANYTLGIWYGNAGNLDAAVAHYKRAIEKAPEFWQARYNLANIYLKTANYDIATVEYKDVLKANTKLLAAQNILDNMAVIKDLQEATSSAVVFGDQLFVNYDRVKGVQFVFPAYFKLEQIKDGVVLHDSDSELAVEIHPPQKFITKSVDDFIKSREKENFGTLTNQGLAQIPNADSAYVKVWSYNSKTVTASEAKQSLEKIASDSANPRNDSDTLIKLQFFLFKGEKVIQVFAYPVIGQMPIFDAILGSIRIE